MEDFVISELLVIDYNNICEKIIMHFNRIILILQG